jgi:hypothetical protein
MKWNSACTRQLTSLGLVKWGPEFKSHFHKERKRKQTKITYPETVFLEMSKDKIQLCLEHWCHSPHQLKWKRNRCFQTVSMINMHFFFFCGPRVWTQDLYLESLHWSFFCEWSFIIGSHELSVKLALNHDPPNLCCLLFVVLGFEFKASSL